ncbi:hypothetical protein RRG08_056827 [Elysia crispata]|uniref:Uncharacterized protein n=1 Tax=Elysia crispata TaxID=231223 RepID=A0AAE1ADV6_9GAST|nr:hypothetical protein RRG08_056827 [Elysia crispata]
MTGPLRASHLSKEALEKHGARLYTKPSKCVQRPAPQKSRDSCASPRHVKLSQDNDLRNSARPKLVEPQGDDRGITEQLNSRVSKLRNSVNNIDRTRTATDLQVSLRVGKPRDHVRR